MVAVAKRWTAIACTALAGLLLGCGARKTYVCSSDAQCGADGLCEADGGCSFPDAECESGRRFAEFTSSGSVCVPAAQSGSTSSTSSTTSTEPGSATLEPDDTSTGVTPVESGSTSSGPDVSTSSSSSTGSSSSSSSEESSTGETPTFEFFDDFERPDSDDVGNGWIEKTPESFALIDGGIRRVVSIDGYPENVVYRPEGNWLDGEAAVELTWLNLDDNFGSPQCFLRTQLADIETDGSVTGYLLFVNGSTGDLTISRQIAGSFTQELIEPMMSPVELVLRYRLRLRVVGSDPVVLDGYLEQLIRGEWTVHTEVHGVDDGAERIIEPGTFAVGGHTQTEPWFYESVALEIFDD